MSSVWVVYRITGFKLWFRLDRHCLFSLTSLNDIPLYRSIFNLKNNDFLLPYLYITFRLSTYSVSFGCHFSLVILYIIVSHHSVHVFSWYSCISCPKIGSDLLSLPEGSLLHKFTLYFLLSNRFTFSTYVFPLFLLFHRSPFVLYTFLDTMCLLLNFFDIARLPISRFPSHLTLLWTVFPSLVCGTLLRRI